MMILTAAFALHGSQVASSSCDASTSHDAKAVSVPERVTRRKLVCLTSKQSRNLESAVVMSHIVCSVKS